jgi:SAM-dependent MidA family methyltransferase
VIRQAIDEAGGRIGFDRYMDLALYAPGLGYYSGPTPKLGASGDFVTAPEVSPLFARCLARQCRQVLMALGGGAILEAGPGSGAMAAGLLATLRDMACLPERYLLLEVSPDLRERQRWLLQARLPELMARIEWIDAPPPGGLRGLVLANELLDALPVHRVEHGAGGWLEWLVVWRDGGVAWEAGPPASAELERALERMAAGRELPGGYRTELGLAQPVWVREMGRCLHAGALLVIDYGYPRHELYHPQRGRGTLVCHYRHRAHDDPLLWPGLQDITAHLDFTALAEAGADAGLDLAGFTTQAQFLLALGLTDDLARAAADPAAYVALAAQVKRLTLPGEMGESFKVLALTRGLDLPLAGFALHDGRARL